jgi:alpha-ribazole phosphatase
LDDIAMQATSQRVLVMTHGGAIRLLRCEAEGRDFADMAGIEVPHASLHTLEWASSSVA